MGTSHEIGRLAPVAEMISKQMKAVLFRSLLQGEFLRPVVNQADHQPKSADCCGRIVFGNVFRYQGTPFPLLKTGGIFSGPPGYCGN